MAPLENESQEVEAPQRRRAMTMRENIRKAGVTEGCPGCKASVSDDEDWGTLAVMPSKTRGSNARRPQSGRTTDKKQYQQN